MGGKKGGGTLKYDEDLGQCDNRSYLDPLCCGTDPCISSVEIRA